MSNEDRQLLNQCLVAMTEITLCQLELHRKVQGAAELLAKIRLRKEDEPTPPNLTRIK